MELGKISEGIEITLGDVVFKFRPANHQDIVFYISILESTDTSKLRSGDSTLLDQNVTHVFTALQAIEGSLYSDGKALTVDDVKKYAFEKKLPFTFTSKVVGAWGAKVAESHGLFETKDAEKKIVSEAE